MNKVAYKTDAFYPAQNRDTFIVTNLYDLIEAVGNEMKPGEEELISVVIQDLSKGLNISSLKGRRLNVI